MGRLKVQDIISKLTVDKNEDQTYSHNGEKDFSCPEGDIAVVGRDPVNNKARPKKSLNSSYT